VVVEATEHAESAPFRPDSDARQAGERSPCPTCRMRSVGQREATQASVMRLTPASQSRVPDSILRIGSRLASRMRRGVGVGVGVGAGAGIGLGLGRRHIRSDLVGNSLNRFSHLDNRGRQ
jgi:hypothetical protein